MADIKILNNDIVSFQGTVGIGTESPGRILDISKTDQSNEFIGIRFTNDHGNGEIGTQSGYTRLYSGGIITYAASSSVSYFYVNNNLGAALDGNGLAIGNTSSTEKLDVYGNARITSRIYSHKTTSGTVVGGEWYRVIELTGGSGRGKCDFIIESAGGSGTPFVLKATVNTAWANDESSIFCHFNSRSSGVGELRVVRNSTSNKSFIDVKFSGGEDAVTVYILPTVNFAADVLPWGNVTTLPAGDAVESSINVTNKVMAHASHRLTETYTDQFVLSYNNKLGIGKDPNYKLDVSDDIYTGIGMYSTYNYSGNRNWAWRLNTFGSGNWGGIGLWQSSAADGNPSSGSIRFGIDQSGNVGINLTTPSEKLEVLGNIRLNTIGNELQFNNHNVGAYRDGNNRLVLGGYGGIQFNAEGVGGMENQSARMIITDTGEVGIGTTEPATQLEIQNSETGNGIGGSTIRLTRNDSTVVAEDPIGGIEFYNKDADGAHISSFIKGVARELYGRLGALSFGTATTNSTNATETMRLSETGNLNVSREGNKNGGTILIGPNENGSHWSFLAGSHYAQGTGAGNGSGSAGVALIGSYSDSANNRVYIGGGPYEINPATTIFFNTHDATTHNLGGTTRMIIDNLGNVAIGKPSASYRLDVEGTINMTGLLVNGNNQISGIAYFEPLANTDAYTRTTTANPTDEWVKVISVAAGPRRIRLALEHGGDNTNAYDEYLISHSSYNMQTHIFRLPGSKYNTSKILGVKAICPSGSTQEVWVKVAGVTSSNGTFRYRSNIPVLDSATVSASAQASEPSNTTGSSVIIFDSNERNAYTTISSGGARLSGHLQGTSASFTDPVTIYDVSTSENPRLSIGRGTDQRLKFSVDDNTATITHEQDEQGEGYPHSMMFTIDSAAATSKTFYWQHRLQNGSGSYTNMYLNSTGLTITDDLYVGGGIIELDNTATTIPAGSMTHYTNGYLYLKGGTGGAAIGNSTFGAAFYAPADNTLQFVAGASEKMRIDTNGQVGIGVTSPDGMLHVHNSNGTKMRHGLYGSIGQRYSSWDTWIGNNTSVATDQTSTIELLTGYLGSGASATKFGFQDFGFYQWAPGDLTGLTAGSKLTLPAPSLYISASKNVGIGTASPNRKLSVAGAIELTTSDTTIHTAHAAIRRGASGEMFLDAPGDITVTIDTNNNNTDRVFNVRKDTGTELFRIQENGNVGVGNTNPQFLLHVGGAGARMRVGPYYTTGGDRDFVDLIADGTDSKVYSNNERFHIQNDVGDVILMPGASSNVGIGTDSPTNKLYVEGGTTLNGELNVNGPIYSQQIATVTYSSLSGSAGGWYKIANISDSTSSPCTFYVKTYAHSSIAFTASRGYFASNQGHINIIDQSYGPNGGYANVAGVRIRQDGDIEIKLNWTSGPSVSVQVTAVGVRVGGLETSLVESTSTVTMNDTIEIATGRGTMRAAGNMLVGVNLGVGTDSPGAKLDVNGAIVSRGGSYDAGTDTSTNVGLAIQEGDYIYTQDGSYLRRLIGKNTADTIEIGQSGTTLIDGVNFFSGTACNYRWHNNGSVAMLLNSTGLQIGNTNTTYALDVTGTIRASSDIIAFSDARVKENVHTIDNALDKVTQLRGVSYNKIGETEEKIGVIAQEIEKVLPQVVQEDDEGMKSVAYGNIVGVLIEAIKEQQKQIDELKARLDGSTK